MKDPGRAGTGESQLTGAQSLPANPTNKSREVTADSPPTQFRRKPYFTGNKLEMDSYKNRYLRIKPISNLCSVAQSCLIPCDPIDCPLSTGIFQARVLEWAAIFFSNFQFKQPFMNSIKYRKYQKRNPTKLQHGASAKLRMPGAAILPFPLFQCPSICTQSF